MLSHAVLYHSITKNEQFEATKKGALSRAKRPIEFDEFLNHSEIINTQLEIFKIE